MFCILSCYVWMKKLRVVGSRSVVSSIKVLAVNIYRLSLDMVIELLMCFPCLEKLYIQVTTCIGFVHIVQLL